LSEPLESSVSGKNKAHYETTIEETELEKQLGEKANQKVKILNCGLSEFLARRGFLLLFFRQKK